MRRRSIVWGAVAGAAAGAASRAFASEAWPQRPVRLVVPYPAGGGPDILTRMIAERVAPLLGQAIVVENKVGAGGAIAAELVAAAEPDGYTLMLGASTHVTQKLISPQFRFDPLTQFVHIVRTSISPAVLVVRADAPYADAAALVRAVQQQPGKLNYASGGIGSAAHLSAAALATAMKVDAVHIPYKGSVDIVPSLINGDTQFAFPIASTALPFITQGRVRALAVTSGTRLAQLPAVPTLREAFKRDELVLDAWSGLWAPARTPDAVVARVNDAVRRAMSERALIDAFDKTGSPVALTRTPAEFSQFVLAETAKYARLVVAARLSAS